MGHHMPALTITAEICPSLIMEVQPGTKRSWKLPSMKRWLKSWKQAAAHAGQQG